MTEKKILKGEIYERRNNGLGKKKENKKEKGGVEYDTRAQNRI